MRLAMPIPCVLSVVLAACSNPAPPANAPPPGELPDTALPATSTPPATAIDAATLGSHHWQLRQASDGRGGALQALTVAGMPPLRIDFADGRIGVATACNRLSGDYTLDRATLRIGRLAATRMACPGERMAQEQLASQLLTGALTATLGQDRLSLLRQDGTRLDFQGDADADARARGDGDTVFLEIDAHTRPCPHPLIPDAQCLQARELHYDAAGLRQGEPGAWQPLYEGVEGYTHEDGVRTVLRVKRYTRANVAADASRIAHVLDMVVETGAAPR